MITLEMAINVLGINDDEVIYICQKHGDILTSPLKVKEVKKKYDIKNTEVIRIYPYHFLHSNSHDWDLIIK